MANKILTNSVLIPIGVPICLENILAMVVLFRCRRMIPQIKMLAINLSITDFCTGFMLCLPDDIVNSCTYKKYLAGPFVVVSLLTITVIFVDRCCSLIFALRYYEIVTKKFLVFTYVCIWIFSFLLIYVMFHDYRSEYGIYCGILYLTPREPINIISRLITLIILLFNIFLYIYLSINVSVRFSRNTAQSSSKDVNGVIRKLSVITGFFLICYSPYIITQVLQGTLYDSTYSGTIHAVSLSLTLLNSAINPVLYVWRFNEARFQLKLLFCLWNRRKTEKIVLERNSFFATYYISYI